MSAGKRKNGFYLWTVRLLVLMLVFGQFGVYGGNRADAATSSGIVSSSNDFQYVMTNNNGKLQVNQKDVNLSWVRSYNISTTGYSFTRRQSILGFTSDITNISFGSYTSKYAGQIDNAFLIDLSKVREISTEMTYRQSGMEVGQWTISNYNVLGQLTPVDVYNYDVRQLSLVVNADTGEVVDFYSELNPYYTRKAEPASFTKQLVAPVTIDNMPAIPAGITGKQSENTVNLNWQHAQQAVQYVIEENGIIKGPYYGTTFVSNGLLPDTLYSYRVRSLNSIGTSEWSSLYEIKTLLQQPVISASSQEGKNIIQWNAVDQASHYQLKIDDETPIELGNVTSYEHEGLAANSSHTYTLKALSSNNESDWSKTITQLVVPDSVSGLKVTEATFNKVALSWTAVKGATGYDLEIDGNIVAVTGTTYSKTGLIPNTEHTFRLRPKNTGGAGNWSDLLTVSTQLSTPVLKSSPSQEEIILVWPSIDGATSYEVEADGVIVGNVVDPTFTHTGLTPATAHKYRVRALTDTNTSAWTAVLTQNTLPGSVAGLTVNSVTNTAIALKWTTVTGATGYDLEIDGIIVAVTGVAYTKSGLAANTDHTFRIRSKNAAGVGTWSDLISGTTLLNTPVLKATSEETAINLTWAEIADATKYEVEADGVVVGTVSEPSYTHSSLLAGTAHKYRVRALINTNTSAWTAILTQSTLPTSVTGLTINSVTNVTIALKWNAVTGATGYDLEIDGTVVSTTATAYNKSGLTANTDHTFRIRSKNAAGVGTWSDLIRGTTQLNTPVLKATSEETAINLTWAEIADATKYEVEADGVVVATVNEPSYTHSGLLAGTAHKYRVRALTNTNTSAWTAILTQSTIPASVSGLTINSVTNVAIALKWNAVTGATGYDLEIDGTVVAVTGVAYTKSGLAANTDHTFRIRSKNAAGVGTWSDLISGTTQLNTPVLKATSEETAINLTWVEIADATKYEVEADGVVVATVNEPSYTHSSLLPGTAHKYRVRALTDTNTSAWTAILTQSTLPASVTGLTINSVTNVAIALKWNAVTGATGYDLEIDGALVSTTAAAYTKSGLAANTNHTFRIRSKNAAGVGTWSELINGTTQLNTPVLKATSEETAINLTWAEIADATKYEVEADGAVVATVNEPSYTHNNLLAGTAHKYRVRALTDTNTSAWTAILTQSTIPASVSGLAINSVTNVAIALKWNAVTGATGYDLEIDGTVVAVTGVAYTKSGLAANTDHTFRIRSKNAAGVGTWSDLISGTTQLNTPVLKATSEETAINLTWAEIADATKYEVEADGVVVATVNEPSYMHSGLLAGTAHKYRVRALINTNTSAWTAILTQSTLPASVSGLTINTVTNAAIALKWNAVTGATGYDLEIDGTVVAVTGVAYTKSGLAANTDHTFRIRSKNAAGVGTWSDLINGTTQLNTPVLKATSEETAINLTWAEIADATKYEVEADGVVVATVNEPSYTHSSLLGGTAHKYRVRALTDTNTSAWTAILTQSTIPASVTGLTVNSVTNTAIALKWNAVTGATGYDLEIDGTIVAVTGVAYTKSGLAANTEHTFRIRSKNAAGIGAWSDLIKGITQLSTPVVKGSPDRTGILLTWDAVIGASTYEIEADGQIVAIINDTTFIHSDLLPSSLHKYRIRALNDQNISAWTSVLSIKTLN
ncbi:fibronectin type III domain-containing protein [Paenibacillus sp. 11B]|uniref:fibronectin type III domain-containing protein n=1 Tax=Paenibacillus sp. 11B TaxID=3060965 RepID=UPI00265211A1|nr:fibronectin type III domain-containing protein [Paenibacillus sp. 11B]MDN8590795.1 fibronectin type III domain-containing protein [Paenibacillus sp. 11B]